MTLKKYLPSEQRWLPQCSKDNCSEQYVICKNCHNFGHFVFWIDNSRVKVVNGQTFYGVMVKVAHAHFVMDKDRGRHVRCHSHDTWIHESRTKLIRTIDGRHLPDFIKEEMNNIRQVSSVADFKTNGDDPYDNGWYGFQND